MRPLGVTPDDPGLRLLKDEGPLQHLTKAQKLRIRFWAWLTDRAERQWLAANGWKEREPGWWFLPEWHPRKLRAIHRGAGRKNGWRREDHYDKGEPYDQNHAANSQRYYIRTVQTPRTRDPMAATQRYERLRRVAALTAAMAPTCSAIGGGIYGHHGLNWVSGLFFLAAALLIGISFFKGRSAATELEMNHVEERLRGAQNNARPEHRY